MEINGKDVYFIAVKAIFRDGDKVLLTHDIFDQWDLPGGRIKKDEFRTDLRDVLRRKIREELGDDIQYEIGELKTSFQVERMEHLEAPQTDAAGQPITKIPVRIFALGFEVFYLGGTIKLGQNHDKYQWFLTKNLAPEKYLANGWEIGLENYLKGDKI